MLFGLPDAFVLFCVFLSAFSFFGGGVVMLGCRVCPGQGKSPGPYAFSIVSLSQK